MLYVIRGISPTGKTRYINNNTSLNMTANIDRARRFTPATIGFYLEAFAREHEGWHLEKEMIADQILGHVEALCTI